MSTWSAYLLNWVGFALSIVAHVDAETRTRANLYFAAALAFLALLLTAHIK